MMPTASPSCWRIARTVRQTRFSGSRASAASSDLSRGSTTGNSAMAGMPSCRASSAALTTPSIESRSTPGMLGTGRLASWSWTKSGQIRSAGASVVSASIRRSQGCWRLRRIRVAGKDPAAVIGFFPSDFSVYLESIITAESSVPVSIPGSPVSVATAHDSSVSQTATFLTTTPSSPSTPGPTTSSR